MPSQRFSPSLLKALREDAGLTRTDVAFAARRSEQSVWLWERGSVRPTIDVLERVASLLGCSVGDFFEEVISRGAAYEAVRTNELPHVRIALQAGVHAKVVQERLGHSDISITLQSYSHVLPGMQEGAAEQDASLVFGS